jgi:hypothetical protein
VLTQDRPSLGRNDAGIMIPPCRLGAFEAQ